MRDRTPTKVVIDDNTAPNDWPNGAAIYRHNTAHLKDNSGLLGHTVRQEDGTYKAWAHKAGKHLYLGRFKDSQRAFQVVCGR